MVRSLRVLALLLLAVPSFAQDPAPPREPITLSMHGGAMQFLEKDSTDRKDFVYRINLTVPVPGKVTLFGRADYTRTQDGGDLLDPKSFRSIEGFLGGRKDIATNLAVTAFTGVSWDRDKEFVPADPRLWTAAAGLKFTVPKRGYVIAAAGHHGPVGGLAFLGSAVFEMSAGAAWFGDIAVPLNSAEFLKNPYTVKVGISARMWERRF
jgi:hypothetical protein